MKAISDGGSRWLAPMLTVLGGSVLLSACSPTSPSEPDVVAAAAVDQGPRGEGTVSAHSASNIDFCIPASECSLIEPVEITGGTDPRVSLILTNVGLYRMDPVHVTSYLLGADGRRIRVSDTSHVAPLPGETLEIVVRIVVPPTALPGHYRVEVMLDSRSGGTHNTWISSQILTVWARR
jgi:hypothetical protein